MAGSIITIEQTSFAAGEVSPKFAVRRELDRNRESLLKAENIMINPYGSFYKRPGTTKLAIVKTDAADDTSQLFIIPFKVSDTEQFLIEINGPQFRVWQIENDDLVLVQELTNLTWPLYFGRYDYAQIANTIIITSAGYPVQQIFRDGAAWTSSAFDIKVPPFGEIDVSGRVISASNSTGAVTLTTSADLFKSTDVGRFIKSYQARPTEVLVPGSAESILVTGAWTMVTAGKWSGTIEIQRQTIRDGVASGVWERFRYYESNATSVAATDQGANFSDQGTAADPILIRMIATGGGEYGISPVNAKFTSVGDTVVGLVKITGVTSAQAATGVVVGPLQGVNTETGVTVMKVWAMSIWGDDPAVGWPRHIMFFQNRLVFANNAYSPSGLWLSRTDDYNNFGTQEVSGGLTDDSAINTLLLSRDLSEIKALAVAANLIVFTASGIWQIKGSTTLTPKSIDISMQSGFGTANVLPATVGSRILYVQNGGQKLRDLGYALEYDSLQADDVSVFNSELFADNHATQITSVSNPDSRIYCLTQSGEIDVLVYLREQKVFAWSRIKTACGRPIAICNALNGDNENLIIMKKIGSTITIEKLDLDDDSPDINANALLDSKAPFGEITANNDGTYTISNLPDYMNGRQVSVFGGPVLMAELTYLARDNAITIPFNIPSGVIGFPYNMNVELLDIHIGDATNSTTGMKKTVTETVFQFSNSFGGYVLTENDTLKTKKPIFVSGNAGGSILNPANMDALLLSGIKAVTPTSESNYTGRIKLFHNSAYPFRVALVCRKVRIS